MIKRRPQAELKQAKRFSTIEEEVCVEVQRTSQVVGRWVVDALKPSGLSVTQFNVLRILRGARPGPLSSCGIAERMVTYDPDLTRLLDRLEAGGLAEKSRDTRDRRVMNVRISKAGLVAVETATRAVQEKLKQEIGEVGPRRLNALAELLECLRLNGA